MDQTRDLTRRYVIAAAASAQDKDQKTLNEQYKGVHGLAAALGSDKKHGLPEDAVEASRGKYGANTYTQVPPKSFFAILYEGFKDPVILLLCAAATVSNRGVPGRT